MASALSGLSELQIRNLSIFVSGNRRLAIYSMDSIQISGILKKGIPLFWRYIVRLLIQHFLAIVWFFFGWYFGRSWRLVNLAKEIRLPTRDFRHLPWSRWREVTVVLNENKVFRAWKFNPIDSLYAFWLFSRWFQMIWLKERPRLLRIS